MSTNHEIYQQASKLLNPNISQHTLRLLLLEINNFNNFAELNLSLDKVIKDELRFWECFHELNAGRPIQYVVNNAGFLGANYYVDQRVLIPRPETEELVDWMIQELDKQFGQQPFALADIGTGSGVIAITIKLHFPNAQVFATDIDSQALEVAAINAHEHGAEITFLKGDLLDPLIKNDIKLDVIVSNPPYIKNVDEVDQNVISYEPHIALFAKNGVDCYARMVEKVHLIARDNMQMYFEIGYDLEKDLMMILRKELPQAEYEFRRDLQGKTRFLHVILRG